MVNLNVSSDPCHVVDPVCMFSIHYVKQECCLSDPGSLNFKICLEQSLMGHLSVHTGALFLIFLIHSFISSTCISRPIHLFIHPFTFIIPFTVIIPLTFIITLTFIIPFTFIIPLTFIFIYRIIHAFIYYSSLSYSCLTIEPFMHSFIIYLTFVIPLTFIFINSIESFMHSFIIPLIFMFNFRTIYPFIHYLSQIHVLL